MQASVQIFWSETSFGCQSMNESRQLEVALVHFSSFSSFFVVVGGSPKIDGSKGKWAALKDTLNGNYIGRVIRSLCENRKTDALGQKKYEGLKENDPSPPPNTHTEPIFMNIVWSNSQ